ncbi:protein FAM221B isoform X2 [Tupaia chinensis]|nr:protein FAM221B isoform X2 [Tupaia chinensis]
METDEITEEPQTTMDAEEHLSSKDPSAEDLQEPPVTETLLEPTISETSLDSHTTEDLFVPSASQPPLEIHTSESLLEPSTSETPVEPHTSDSPLVPSTSQTPVDPHTSKSPFVSTTSQTPLETHTSESLVEPSIARTPSEHSKSEISLENPTSKTMLETHISNTPEKHLSFSPSSVVPMSFSDALKEDFASESSTVFPWTTRFTQLPESERLPKHSLPGPSVQVLMDTSSKQKEESGEDKKEGMDTSDGTAHTAQPGHQLSKKKGKKGYTVHPVVPAKQAELVEVAKAMHREQFGAQVKNLFQWETDAALNAIQTGLYIGWRCPHYLWDCFRIGDESKCFCGHLLREHQIISDISVPCHVSQCRCLMFCFIPSRPEEVGEFWLRRRATFDPKAWRAQCRCKHSHEDHSATGCHPCRHRGCCCSSFESNFLCAACDRRWEEHETFFETRETRRRGGRPYGTDTVNNWRRTL